MEDIEFNNLNKFLIEYSKKIEDEYISRLKNKNYDIKDVDIKIEFIDDTYILNIKLSEYLYWIENGRGPGKMPPINKITNWVRKNNIKPKTNNITEKSLVYLISRKIGLFGTKPKNLLSDSIDKVIDNDFNDNLIEAVKLDIQEWNKNNIKIKI